MTATKFPFIVLVGPDVPQDARAIIRKQAMKGRVLTRKQAVSHGQIKKRQQIEPQCTYGLLWSSNISLSDYDRVRSRFGVELTDLSALASFGVGRSTGVADALVSVKPTQRTASLFHNQQWSYMHYVPARYGTNSCLTATTDAVLAKIRAILSPDYSSAMVSSHLYGVALHAVQEAIGDAETVKDADVLCATQLLSMHELLEPTSDNAWSHHLEGTAQLFMHRTASRFTTDLEKGLLVAHVAAMLLEALVSNTHCYLEQPEWIAVYRSLAQESDSPFLNPRSPLVINLKASLLALPGLWHDVGEAVDRPEFLTHNAGLHLLEPPCHTIHSEIVGHFAAYELHCLSLPSRTHLPEFENTMRREFEGLAFSCFIIIKYILATICEDERLSFVAGAQAAAHLLLKLHEHQDSSLARLFSGVQVALANVIIRTKGQWEEDLTGESLYGVRLASRRRHNEWSSSLGRRRVDRVTMAEDEM